MAIPVCECGHLKTEHHADTGVCTPCRRGWDAPCRRGYTAHVPDLPHVDIDLDNHVLYREGAYTEWAAPGRLTPGVSALSEPDARGNTLWFSRGTQCTRDEMPALIAWLTAVHHATAPEAGA